MLAVDVGRKYIGSRAANLSLTTSHRAKVVVLDGGLAPRTSTPFLCLTEIPRRPETNEATPRQRF